MDTWRVVKGQINRRVQQWTERQAIKRQLILGEQAKDWTAQEDPCILYAIQFGTFPHYTLQSHPCPTD